MSSAIILKSTRATERDVQHLLNAAIEFECEAEPYYFESSVYVVVNGEADRLDSIFGLRGISKLFKCQH